MTAALTGQGATAAPRVLRVAFCPSTPLLLPAVARGAAAETATLRAACGAAVDELLAAAPRTVVVVGAGAPEGSRYGPGDGGDFRGFGVDLEIPFAGPRRPGGAGVPLTHTIGAWLLDQAGYAGLRLGVAPGDLSEALRELPGPVAVLAVGDGSARRSIKAPGYLDDAAAPFDAAVAAALASGDAAGLAALDPAEGKRLQAAGVPVWRAVGAVLAGRSVAGHLRYDDAPYGVGYLVADWTVDQVAP